MKTASIFTIILLLSKGIPSFAAEQEVLEPGNTVLLRIIGTMDQDFVIASDGTLG